MIEVFRNFLYNIYFKFNVIDTLSQHMTGYSPISSRSHRTSVHITPYQIQTIGTTASRRRESINSSIGATSIRRLLTVNQRGCRYKIPVHIKTKVTRNFILLVLAHGLSCSILIPLFGLQVVIYGHYSYCSHYGQYISLIEIMWITFFFIFQGSSSTWFHKKDWINLGPNIGSLLLSICFLVTAGMCLLTRQLLKRLGYVALLVIAYAGLCVFLLAHVYPSIYTLVPAYMLLGVTLGPAWISKWNLVVFFASRISCGQQECSTNVADGVEEHKAYCNRDERVRRLARWYHAAENMGIVGGALVASLVMTTCVSHDCSWFYATNIMGTVVTDSRILNVSNVNLSSTDHVVINVATSESSQSMLEQQQIMGPTGLPLDQLINTMFNTNGHGERICGADACPVSMLNYAAELFNDSRTTQLESHPGSTPLVLVYLAIGLVALLLTAMQQHIDNMFREDKARGLTDTLMFAGPLAYFIGTEQGYVLGDFTKVNQIQDKMYSIV